MMATQFPGDQSNTMVARAKRLLMNPIGEWAAIDAEPMTSGQIFTGWVVPLAAIGPVAQLIGSQLFGIGFLGIHYRPPLITSLATAVLSYVMALISVWVIALIIDMLAPTFNGTKNATQALKVAAFSMTAGWLAGIFGILPAIAFLGLIGLYSLYLLYLGLPRLMRVAPDKAMPYTVAVILVAAVVMIVGGLIAGSIVARVVAPPTPIVALGDGQVGGTVTLPNGSGVDLGKLDAAAKRMAAASEAIKQGNGTPAIAAQTLQAMLPGSVGGWNRTEIESQSGGAAGINGSHAEARYASGDQSFRLSVTDTGALGSLATLGGALNVQSNKETATGYERAQMVDGRMTSEKWDTASKSGSVGVMVANRFMVEAEGSAPSIDTLKGAVAAVDLGKLDALTR